MDRRATHAASCHDSLGKCGKPGFRGGTQYLRPPRTSRYPQTTPGGTESATGDIMSRPGT